MEPGIIILICVLAVVSFVVILLLGIVIARKKGRCRRTHYSHDITTESQAGEILAVVSTTNRAQAVEKNTQSKPTTNATFSSPTQLFLQQQQRSFMSSLQQSDQQTRLPFPITSVSGQVEFDRRNGLLTGSERVFSLRPPYTGFGGPPSYTESLALQRLRSSIR